MTTIAEELVAQLALRGVECVFGILGVHTIELYRGLASSGIRHVTSRHEQGAGFMADSYARVSGKPGVAFVITGPGLTNALSAMAQARADSVPIIFMIWNSHGFQEIETSMRAVGVTVCGCDPTPPDLATTAQSMSAPHTISKPDPAVVGLALKKMAANTGPSIIEVHASLHAKHKKAYV